MEKLTKTQKIVIGFVVLTAIVFLVWGCGTAVNNEVKTDSTLKDSVVLDTLTIDTTKVYGKSNQAIK
jgi:hypothetical protein